MSVFMICERVIGLIRGNRLVLTAAPRARLEALDYEGLTALTTQQEAVSCVRHFAAVRDRMLVANPWLFARASVMLALSGASVEGWPYSFTVPNDCLSIQTLVRRGAHGERLVEKYERTRNLVSCRYNVVELRYTRRVTNTDEWDPLFEDAFCYALAGAIIAGVTGEASAHPVMEQGAQLRIAEAVNCGAIMKPLSLPVERYAFQGFSDRLDPMYSDGGDAW